MILGTMQSILTRRDVSKKIKTWRHSVTRMSDCVVSILVTPTYVSVYIFTFKPCDVDTYLRLVSYWREMAERNYSVKSFVCVPTFGEGYNLNGIQF